MKRILVVDDEEIIRYALAEILRNNGYQAHSANGGVAAMHSMQTIKPDIVITDYAMPGMNGLGLLRHIKREHPDIPVIMFSGSDGVKKDALEAGACTFITKTGNVTEKILTAVTLALGKQEESNELRS